MFSNAEMLAEVPFFALLDDQERATLAERIEVVTVEAGTTLFNRGDPGDSLYVVKRGEVEIWVKNDQGEKLVLERARTGDFFGEISLLDEGPRTATAKAMSQVSALVVDRGDLDELFRVKPAAALDLLAATGRRLRHNADLLRTASTRNPNEEQIDNRSVVMKVADWIAAFSGSLPFLFIHLGAFAVWILLNAGPLSKMSIGGFDPFPFGFLTLVVSLEAIILSVFVLLSQNRQVQRDSVRNDIEYDVNLKAEMQIAHMHEKHDTMYVELLKRMDRMEKLMTGKPVSMRPPPVE